MKTKKRFKVKTLVVSIMMAVAVLAVGIPGVCNAASIETCTYSTSPHSLKKFCKKGHFLYLKSEEDITRNNAASGKTFMELRLAKKCRWIYKNKGNRSPKAKVTKSMKYKKFRGIVKKNMKIPENGYHTINIRVLEGYVTKVVFVTI